MNTEPESSSSEPQTQRPCLESSLITAQSLVDQQSNLFDDLTEIKVWAYGVGHFFNDLGGACWFNFLFYYLKTVVNTPAATPMIVVGQVADGIATPLIGYLSDRFSTKYGKRIPWYIGGLAIFTVSFLGLYQNFKFQNQANDYVYYCTVSIFANLGWAAIQISHMSLVPELTCSRKRRDRLNNLRNTFNFVANFLTLGLGLIIFKFMANPPLEYAIISYFLAFIGFTASIFFLWNIKQVPLTTACSLKAYYIKEMIESVSNSEQDQILSASVSEITSDDRVQTIAEWFKMPKFYLFGICYMGARLTVNMFGTFLPFYLVGVLKLGEKTQDDEKIIPFAVALVPLIVYLSSVASSSALNTFYLKFGRKKALTVGALLCSLSLVTLILVNDTNAWLVYVISIFIGISMTISGLSQPMILSTSINFISDVIGRKSKSGAFIFGAYSLVDKFSAGIVIFLIGNSEAYKKRPYELNLEQITYIKFTFLLIPCLSCLLASLIVIGYPIKEYRKPTTNEDQFEHHHHKIQEEFVQ